VKKETEMNKEALLEKAEKEEEEWEKDLQNDEDQESEKESDDESEESEESDNDNEDDEVPASVRRQRWFSDPMFSNLEGDSSSEDEARRSEKRERPLAERLRAYSRRSTLPDT